MSCHICSLLQLSAHVPWVSVCRSRASSMGRMELSRVEMRAASRPQMAPNTLSSSSLRDTRCSCTHSQTTTQSHQEWAAGRRSYWKSTIFTTGEEEQLIAFHDNTWAKFILYCLWRMTWGRYSHIWNKMKRSCQESFSVSLWISKVQLVTYSSQWKELRWVKLHLPFGNKRRETSQALNDWPDTFSYTPLGLHPSDRRQKTRQKSICNY